MKILHLLSQNHLTGAEVYATTLARMQLNDGHQVYQISNGFFAESAATQVALEVETKSRVQTLNSILKLRSFIKTNEIQVIHTHSRAAAKLAYWARAGLKVGMVSTIHGQQHSSLSKKLFNQYGELMIAVCENIKKHLVHDFSYPSRRIQTLRNPIDESVFVMQSKPRSPVKKIAIIGRTTGPKKLRTELVLKALAYVDYQITLIGGRISDLDLPEAVSQRVTEASYDRLTSLHYADFDFVIGAGRVCMEALLSGIPTISFGESEYIGLIRLENFSAALASNFGDINLQSSGPRLKAAALLVDLEANISSEELMALRVQALKEFAATQIHQRIIRFYESAFFLRNYSKWIPVLMYHKIPNEEIDSQHRIFVLKKNFEKHLKFFKRWGFTTLTFSDLQAFRTGEKDFTIFPKKPLILTFDDGYKDNLDNASPLLKKYGFRAQLFLLADTGIADNQWDIDSDEPAHEIVAGADRQQWLSSAFEIGSHGFSHRKITDLTEAEAFLELKASKEYLENEFKTKINSFAFTYGITTDRAATWAFGAGYDYAVNTDSGGLLIEEAPYQIFRVNIFPEDDSVSLWKKTSAWYRNYYFRKRRK